MEFINKLVSDYWLSSAQQKCNMRYCLLLIVGLLATFCVFAQNNLPTVFVKDVPSMKLRIDPTYARGGRTSQIFDTVIYTPLETRKDVVVGFTHNLQVSTHYFVFFDQDFKGIYIFYRNGKYKTSINKLPIANWNKQEDGYMFQDFYLDKKSERIFVLYNDKSRENNRWMAIFSPEGTLLKSRKLPALVRYMDFRVLDIDSSGDKSTILAHYANPKEKSDSNLAKYHFYQIQNFDSITSSMVPRIMDKAIDPLANQEWIQYYADPVVNGRVVWSRAFDYTVYRSDDKGRMTKFQVLFPLSYSIDSSFYKDTVALKSWDKAYAYFEGKNKLTQSLRSIVEINDWLVFTMQNRTWPNPILFYNLKNQKLVDFNKITSDSMSYFLPLKSWRVETADNGSIYTIIPAFKMFQAKESREDVPWETNPVLKEYFTRENRKSNPVIVQLKLKSNL